ncbi:hypothetical protein GTQ99_00595 [Kineococcus sp. T13]|uniref:recombination directionality factor n=1 Tax=Kineococcus vitellinus TaxID=2696565 RepID=UPI001412DD7C|nr:hypothetical protein [Kineococcus vitellinus]NAZ73930.1 hypothetical protein [Kineococcus vitellinus]
MPINTLQRRGRQIGEIRIGMQVEGVTKNGKKIMRPSKLEAFRFTTKSAVIAQAVADLFGGQAKAVVLLNNDSTHEVVTSVTEVPVMVPPGDNVVSQWMEMWSKGGCQRRCDGETEQLTQTPCKCPFDQEQRNALASKGNACKPVTRLNVMLPDLPDLGVWMISSNGWNAAQELGGTAEVLAAARAQGQIIPATLRLEQRQSVKGGETRKFPVPVLELRSTLRQMTALDAGGDITTALPPPPPQAQVAIGAGAAPDTVNLFPWICDTLAHDQLQELKAAWRGTFDFMTTAVPTRKESAVRALVLSYRSSDDEPIDAEVVVDYPFSQAEERSGVGAEGNERSEAGKQSWAPGPGEEPF